MIGYYDVIERDDFLVIAYLCGRNVGIVGVVVVGIVVECGFRVFVNNIC